MRIRLSELRKVIAEAVASSLSEEKKLPVDDGPAEAHYDSMPCLSAIADDSDVLLDDSEVVEGEKESFMVPPEVQKKLRHYFKSMGLSGHLPKQARFK